MTKTGFVIANLFRKRTRTILTLLSVIMAFLLFGLLQSVNSIFNAGQNFVGATRLMTQARVSFTQPLPISMVPKLEAIPGVARVGYSQWFGGVWQENTPIFAFAVDPLRQRDVYPEYIMPDAQWQAFANTRTGMIAGKVLADKYGWKIGQKIPLSSNIYPQKNGSKAWAFDLVGIYDGTTEDTKKQAQNVFISHDYFDEANAVRQGARELLHPQARRRQPGRGDQQDRRCDVRELPGRDQDPDREGLQPRLRQADRRHRPDRALDPVRGVLHAAAGGRQHHGAERARARPGACRAQDPRVLRRRVLGFVFAEALALCLFGGLVGTGAGNACGCDGREGHRRTVPAAVRTARCGCWASVRSS